MFKLKQCKKISPHHTNLIDFFEFYMLGKRKTGGGGRRRIFFFDIILASIHLMEFLFLFETCVVAAKI